MLHKTTLAIITAATFPILITGCPGVTPNPDNGDALTVSLFCPSADQPAGQSLTINATPNRTTATTTFEVTGDATSTTDANALTLNANAAGDVTVTVTATDGNETATDTCTITYTDDTQPDPLAVTITCPSGITTIDDIAQISASANDPIAVIRFESTTGELNDNEDATATLTSDQPDQITVTATATVDGQSATASCTINFESPADTREPIAAATVTRTPFASSCAQNVVNCTTSFPVAVVDVAADASQTVTETDEGFLVEGSSESGAEVVNLIGANSAIGNTANELFFSWSVNATDDNPCTLAPGTEVSTNANDSILLAVGTHYVRLTVRNDLIREAENSGIGGCGVIPEDFKSDFREVAIEVRDMQEEEEDDDDDMDDGGDEMPQ